MALNELTRRCLYLPKVERARLARVLAESLEAEERVDDGSRFSIFIKAAEDVCGKGILTQCRDFNHVMGRRMIAYKMRQEGCSFMTIGKHLIRHHASVIHMCNMMEDALKFGFHLEMSYWDKFNKRIKEYETDTGTIQDSQSV